MAKRNESLQDTKDVGFSNHHNYDTYPYKQTQIPEIFLCRACHFHMCHLFPTPFSYNRFTKLWRKARGFGHLVSEEVPHMVLYSDRLHKQYGMWTAAMIPHIACLKAQVHMSQSSMRWICGFNQHLICNKKDEQFCFFILPSPEPSMTGFRLRAPLS